MAKKLRLNNLVILFNINYQMRSNESKNKLPLIMLVKFSARSPPYKPCLHSNHLIPGSSI